MHWRTRTSTALLVSATVAFCVAISLATSASAAAAPFDQTKPGAHTSNVSSTLVQLVSADDRAAFAAAHGIDLRDGRVVVVVELQGRSTVPEGYDVTVQQTATVGGETFVQALVPVDELVPLSEERGVAYVRLPDRADAGGGETATADPRTSESPPPSTPAVGSSTQGVDVLVVVTAIGVAVGAVALYGSLRR